MWYVKHADMGIIFILINHVCSAVILHTSPIAGIKAVINVMLHVVTVVDLPVLLVLTVSLRVYSYKIHQVDTVYLLAHL